MFIASDAGGGYSIQVLEQVEQIIFTEPTSETNVDTSEKKLH